MGKARSVAVTQPGWYVETTADGGAHHGRLKDPDPRLSSALSIDASKSIQIVVSDCGRTFKPLFHATRQGQVIRWEEPVDEGHACPACWETVHGKGTSFYEVAHG